MQASVFCLLNRIFNHQLTDEAEVPQLHNLSCGQRGFPHHVNFVSQQVQASFGSFESLVGANDADLLGHGPYQTEPVVDDGSVFAQGTQPVRSPLGMRAFVGGWRMLDQVRSHALGVHHGFEETV